MSHRRRYRGPHPYARMGCLGPQIGCSGCLLVILSCLLAGLLLGVFG